MRSRRPSCCSRRCACRSCRRWILSRPPMTRRPRRKATRGRGCLLSAALIIVIAAVALVIAWRGSGTGEVRVIIPRGATLRVAADSLEKHGVIENATAFRLYALVRRGDRSIRAGTYLFKRPITWGRVLEDLRGGKGIEHGITIPEGWSLSQIVPQLARVLGAPIE